MRQRVHQGGGRIAPCTRRPLRGVDYPPRMYRVLAVLALLLALAPASAARAATVTPPAARAPRRPEPHHLRPAPRPVHDRRLRDAAEGGRRPSRRRSRARSSGWTRGSSTRPARSSRSTSRCCTTSSSPTAGRTTSAPTRPARCKTTRERFCGTSEELRPLTLPPGYGYPTNPADRWRAFDDGHAPSRRRARVLRRVPRDGRPAPDDPGQAVLAEHHPVLARPAVDGPGRRHQDAHAPRASSRCPRRAGSSPSAATCTAARKSIHLSQPRCGDRTLVRNLPAYAPAGDPLYAVRPLLHEPDPKSISWWQSATGWPIRDGRAAQGHRRLRQHAPAHAGDGHRARLRRAAAGRRGGRTAAHPRPPDAQALGAEFAHPRMTPPTVALTLARLDADGIAR